MSEANGQAVVRVSEPRLPYHAAIEERFGIDKSQWRALTDAVFPTASTTDAVILALSYCKARKLDPFKKPVQIVPMWSKTAKAMVDTVWPGIGELRTTAFRTGQYAGRDAALFGEMRTAKLGAVEMQFPEWCEVVVYRLVGGVRVPFHGPRVYWMETYATAGKDSQEPNAMWRKRPSGQIEKCAEAAALRAAFPEEIGNEYAAEEMEGRVLDVATLPEIEVRAVPSGKVNASQAKKGGVYEAMVAEIRALRTTEELMAWRDENRQRIANLPKSAAGDWSELIIDEWDARFEAVAANEGPPPAQDPPPQEADTDFPGDH